MAEAEWVVPGSRESHDTVNPINQFLEVHLTEPIKKSTKELIQLGKGDPTMFGNLPPHPAVMQALQDVIASGVYNGYDHSSGNMATRKAVAQLFSRYSEKNQLSYEDVFMTPGAHCALEICLRVLVEPGQCILLSRPCYTIYNCLANAIGASVRHYNLLPEKEWEVDLGHLEEQLSAGGAKVAAVVINNPSNPCGSVYSKKHLLDILKVIGKFRVPIIADEVYMDMVYKGHTFHPIGSLSDDTPVLSCSSVSKKYLVPGWRVGWIAAYDRNNTLTGEIKPGIARMLTKVLVPSTLLQAAIPDMLKNVPDSHITQTMEVFESNSNACYSRLKDVPGLHPIRATGSMYIMIEMAKSHFPEFEDDVEFVKQLIVEQGIVTFPGSIFLHPWSMRVTLIMPNDKLVEACDRITQFCQDHYKH